MIEQNQVPIKVGIRDGGEPEDVDYVLHIECRFPDGRKGAMVQVDPAYPDLARLISAFLNDPYMIEHVRSRADL